MINRTTLGLGFLGLCGLALLGLIIMICLGHNGDLIKTFCGITGAMFPVMFYMMRSTPSN